MDARSAPALARQRPSRHKSCKAAVSKALTCPGKRSKTVLLAQSSRHFPFQPVSARIYFHKHACCGNKSRSTSTAPQSAATEPPVLLRWGYFTPKAFHRLQAAHIHPLTGHQHHQRCALAASTRGAAAQSSHGLQISALPSQQHVRSGAFSSEPCEGTSRRREGTG